MIITSLDNAKIVEVVKLRDKKYRRTTGLYVIEGERLVRDAVGFGAQILEIFVKESAQNKFCFENQIVVADKVFSKMSDTVSSQGVLAVVKKPQKDLGSPQGNCLILDGLQDPGNVGTLIRTAAACGFTDIFAVNTVDIYSSKVLRSAMSAHFCVNVRHAETLQEVFDGLSGFQIVAADMHGESIFSAELKDKVAVVLGNEGNGLSSFSREHSDVVLSLPMKNNFESLNVAVAGSVIMYHIFGKSQTKQHTEVK